MKKIEDKNLEKDFEELDKPTPEITEKPEIQIPPPNPLDPFPAKTPVPKSLDKKVFFTLGPDARFSDFY